MDRDVARLRAVVPAIGYLIGAMRSLESVVGRTAPQQDPTMADVSRQLAEATRIMCNFSLE